MKCRYICRDIKPSNFVIGLEENNAQRRMFIVDFGLCRRYVDAVCYLETLSKNVN